MTSPYSFRVLVGWTLAEVLLLSTAAYSLVWSLYYEWLGGSRTNSIPVGYSSAYGAIVLVCWVAYVVTAYREGSRTMDAQEAARIFSWVQVAPMVTLSALGLSGLLFWGLDPWYVLPILAPLLFFFAGLFFSGFVAALLGSVFAGRVSEKKYRLRPLDPIRSK